MQIVQDDREQKPLSFIDMEGCQIVKEKLEVGDYAMRLDDGSQLLPYRIERKSVADLFSSFSSNYEAERNKIIRAKTANLKYIIAIEASCSEIRKGHSYWDGEKMKEAAKSGLAQVRQLMTIAHKYQVEIWFCESRADMAFRIQEYFLALEKRERLKVAA